MRDFVGSTASDWVVLNLKIARIYHPKTATKILDEIPDLFSKKTMLWGLVLWASASYGAGEFRSRMSEDLSGFRDRK